MIKMWKKTFIYALSCLVTLSAHASTIPTYTIASVTGGSILLTDNSVLSINGAYAHIASEWMPGDLLYLGQANLSLFPPVLTDVNGIPVSDPSFIVQNATQGTSAIGFFSTMPSLTPLLLLTINPVNGVIVTSAPTPYRIRPVDRRYFVQWQTGDVLMIGKNLGSNRTTYDTVIFNATRLETVNAFEISP